NEYNEAVMAEAGQAVAGTLQAELANGNVADVMALFNGKSNAQIMSSPVAQNMQSGFLENITGKLGINKNVAMGLASTLLPMVISQLVKRTNSTEPQHSGFNIASLIGSLTGGGQGGGGGLDIGNIISQFTGGGQQQPQAGGGFDIGSIISQIAGGAQQQKGGGGLSSLIQGFFGK
ncbi:MAG: hypothetical protein EAY75_00700, partial [Bacteroidetes bacterium]